MVGACLIIISIGIVSYPVRADDRAVNNADNSVLELFRLGLEYLI